MSTVHAGALAGCGVARSDPAPPGPPHSEPAHEGGPQMIKSRATHRAIALVAALGLVAGACGGDDDSSEPAEPATEEPSDEPAEEPADEPAEEPAGEEPAEEPADAAEPVTIEWWHIQNSEPATSNWQAVADQFMADNPNVTIDITVMENE